jgi:hypothetical protein
MSQGCWKFSKAKATFSYFSNEWQTLCSESVGSHPLLNSDFIAPLIDHFGTDKLILARYEDEAAIKAMVLLERKKSGIWETFAPGPAPLGAAIFSAPSTQEKIFMLKSLARSLPGFTFMIGFNRLDPAFQTILNTNHDPFPGNIELLNYVHTLRLTISADFETYWSSRGRNLRRDIQRKYKRAKDSGISIILRQLYKLEDMAYGVRVYGEIESRGWKGLQNTAVHFENERGKFYTKMLKAYSKRSCALIYQLLFGDVIVASALAVTGQEMIILLKITMDEAMAKFSPGWLMMYEIHKHIFQMSEIKSIEYYCNATERQRQWSDDLRPMYHLNYYIHSAAKNIHNKIKSAKTFLIEKHGRLLTDGVR